MHRTRLAGDLERGGEDTLSEGDPGTLDLPLSKVQDALAPTDDPAMLGRLGPYEVSGIVGSGAMGVVMKALDPSLDRVVAIKVMAPELAANACRNRVFSFWIRQPDVWFDIAA